MVGERMDNVVMLTGVRNHGLKCRRVVYVVVDIIKVTRFKLIG